MVGGQQRAAVVIYEIVVKGHLDDCWGDWFEGLAFIHKSDGTTRLRGPVTDQAALYGILNGIRDLGLMLVSVNSFESAGSISKLDQIRPNKNDQEE